MVACIIFSIFVLCFLYAYFGYPLLLAVLGLFRGKNSGGQEITGGEYPEVSILIAAYNEEDVIEKKIKNSLALDYPKEKLHVVVVSDGSTDGTDDIVRGYESEGVELFRVEGRMGKTVARNKAVERAKAEILVFTDANAFFNPDALEKLILRFRDPSVGAVCGALVLKRPDDSENLYWRYEKLIKVLEDRFHSIIGANGSIYAIRKELYTPLPPEVDDDFVEPLLVYLKGKKVVYERKAVSVENDIPAEDIQAEFHAKRRVVLRGLQSLSFVKETLNPLSHPVLSFEIFSHKIMKWSVPFSLVGIFVSTFFLPRTPFSITVFLAEVVFIIASILGIFMKRGILHIPAYFLVTNAAVGAAVLEFIFGKRSTRWEKRRG